MGHRTLALAAPGLALLAGVAHGAVIVTDADPPRAEAAARSKKQGLGVSGRVHGLLYPGVRRTLVLKVSNRLRRPVKLTSVRVRVKGAPRGCRKRYLAVRRFRRRPRLRARRARRVRLRVMLARSAPDSCQGAIFRLRYSVRAVGVGRRR
jgi:hypothetical protein